VGFPRWTVYQAKAGEGGFKGVQVLRQAGCGRFGPPRCWPVGISPVRGEGVFLCLWRGGLGLLVGALGGWEAKIIYKLEGSASGWSSSGYFSGVGGG